MSDPIVLLTSVRLIAFLRAQLAVDEALVQRARSELVDDGERLFADITAKHAILDDLADYLLHDSGTGVRLASRTALRLAQPYVGRPGWDDAWRMIDG